MSFVKVIANAVDFYEAKGYKPVEVPWLCSEEVFKATAPEGSACYKTSCENKDADQTPILVGSAEQGFLSLISSGRLRRGKYQAFSPCFRGDSPDDLHQNYFYKLELIRTDKVDLHGLTEIVHDAFDYYQQFLKVTLQATSSFSVDIVDQKFGIELGSYGIKFWGNSQTGLSWIYGTGVAEPRLTQVIKRVRNSEAN